MRQSRSRIYQTLHAEINIGPGAKQPDRKTGGYGTAAHGQGTTSRGGPGHHHTRDILCRQIDPRRVAVVAAGGLSHAPGERIHGSIDTAFDLEFIRRLTANDVDGFTSYTDEEIERLGLGTHEIRAWVAVAGIAEGRQAKCLFYEPIVTWATGCGLLYYE